MADGAWAFFKGDYRPIGECTVNIRSKAINYGLGCFEGVRAYWSKKNNQLSIFRAQEHYERLQQSCKIIHLNLTYSVQQLMDITAELLRRNGHREDVYIRPLVFNNLETMTPALTDDPAEFGLYTLPLRDYLDTSKGITAGVTSWRRVTDNMIPARAKPTAAYLNSALARYDARTNGYDEAIFLTQDGYVSEGSAEHVFLVREGKFVTPTSQEDNLDGITRRTIIEMMPELGYEVVQRRISRTELYIAEEAFFCGTGAEITPVVMIDHRQVGDGKPGPMTLKTQELYFRIVRGEEPKFKRWCTAV